MKFRNQLHEMNPAIKFLVVVVSMLTVAWFFNPWTPALFFVGIVTDSIVIESCKLEACGYL